MNDTKTTYIDKNIQSASPIYGTITPLRRGETSMPPILVDPEALAKIRGGTITISVSFAGRNQTITTNVKDSPHIAQYFSTHHSARDLVAVLEAGCRIHVATEKDQGAITAAAKQVSALTAELNHAAKLLGTVTQRLTQYPNIINHGLQLLKHMKQPPEFKILSDSDNIMNDAGDIKQYLSTLPPDAADDIVHWVALNTKHNTIIMIETNTRNSRAIATAVAHVQELPKPPAGVYILISPDIDTNTDPVIIRPNARHDCILYDVSVNPTTYVDCIVPIITFTEKFTEEQTRLASGAPSAEATAKFDMFICNFQRVAEQYCQKAYLKIESIKQSVAQLEQARDAAITHISSSYNHSISSMLDIMDPLNELVAAIGTFRADSLTMVPPKPAAPSKEEIERQRRKLKDQETPKNTYIQGKCSCGFAPSRIFHLARHYTGVLPDNECPIYRHESEEELTELLSDYIVHKPYTGQRPDRAGIMVDSKSFDAEMLAFIASNCSIIKKETQPSDHEDPEPDPDLF